MLSVYPAIIHEESGYWVEFPDLEGCQTCGATLEETIALAQEALGLYLVSLAENNQPIPRPSSLASVTAEDGQKSYIATDVNIYRRNVQAKAS